MSMTLTRLPLEQIGMNAPKRRSARLSQEGSHAEDTENQQDVEGTRGAGRGANRKDAVTVATKESDGAGSAAAAGRRKRKDYDLEVDDFKFTKKRARTNATTTAKDPTPSKAVPVGDASPAKQRAAPLQQQPPAQVTEKPMPPPEKPAQKAPDKKSRRRLPTTPDRDQPKRRSKRLSNEGPEEQQQESQQKQHKSSPHKPAHAKSHANHARSPSPSELARPVTVEKKRKAAADNVEEQKTMRIQLPFQDTPVIRRNREMRKTGGFQGGSRRSSSGMRGRRASSLIDEGRGSALPHAEVLSSEFYKHISAEVPENRRMRCLLGWCGMRALLAKPDAPKESTPAANLEFQALQAGETYQTIGDNRSRADSDIARVIQEELSQDLITKGSLSDWFSRDEVVPPTAVTLRKKPNPRNVANAAKAEELEKELERLKQERAEWDTLIASAKSAIPLEATSSEASVPEGSLSPINASNLDSPQRRILEQLQAPTLALSSSSESNPSTTMKDQPVTPPSSSDPSKPSTENPPAQASSLPSSLEDRLRHVTQNLEFTIDQFAHGVHALATTRETGDRLADHTLADAADVLARREQERRSDSKAVDPLLALRGLARVLNGNRSAAQQR